MVKTAAEIRKKMQQGQASLGTWMQFGCTDVAEILGASGYDWVAVDLEHGGFSRQQLADLFRAIENGGAAPFARVAESSMVLVRSALDAGARGIILPMIASRSQLESIVQHIFYPPQGGRGVGYCRANMFGRDFTAYLNGPSRETLVVAMIEHVDAIEHLDGILTVPELDAIMVGPYDLSGSMGVPGQFNNPEFEQAMSAIAAAAKKHGVPMGAHVVQPDPKLLKQRMAEGYSFLAYGIDAVFLYNGSQCPDI